MSERLMSQRFRYRKLGSASNTDSQVTRETDMVSAVSVTRDSLNALMEIDHVIQVHEDGTVSEPKNIYAPEVWCRNGDYHNPVIMRQESHEWELVNGFSGQFLYPGPIMDPSEYIGGRMADSILETPGVYVAVEVRDLDADTDNGEDDSVGWAVARTCGHGLTDSPYGFAHQRVTQATR